jgi:DNA-binding NarL/FixJ family response regulator
MPTRATPDGASRSTVFIVDDHPVFREGLARIINRENNLVVCGEASGAAEALRRLDRLKPDLVIVDIALEGMNGIDLARSVRTRLPDSRVLMVSMYPESLYGERALRAGAHGYVMKRESGRTLLAAMRRVLAGKTYVSRQLNERILRHLSCPGRAAPGPEVDRLSDRERQVFELIGQGLGTRAIAERLGVSMKTVETHREHIKDKLGLGRTAELVQRAIQWVHHDRPALGPADPASADP